MTRNLRRDVDGLAVEEEGVGTEGADGRLVRIRAAGGGGRSGHRKNSDSFALNLQRKNLVKVSKKTLTL
jgi:hypothetical protein